MNPEVPRIRFESAIDRGDALQVSEMRRHVRTSKADIGGNGLNVRFVRISAASHPSFVRSLSYMREMPTERAMVPRNELVAYGVGCWLSRHRDLTLDPRKRGHAFQPGMAW
jgi:hypothetical protein